MQNYNLYRELKEIFYNNLTLEEADCANFQELFMLGSDGEMTQNGPKGIVKTTKIEEGAKVTITANNVNYNSSTKAGYFSRVNGNSKFQSGIFDELGGYYEINGASRLEHGYEGKVIMSYYSPESVNTLKELMGSIPKINNNLLSLSFSIYKIEPDVKEEMNLEVSGLENYVFSHAISQGSSYLAKIIDESKKNTK